MTKPQDTRIVQKQLRKAGFLPGRTVGSHTTWMHPCGVKVTVPDGHRGISSGVYRSILASIQEAASKEEKK